MDKVEQALGFARDLAVASLKGEAPPQNWTSEAIRHIKALTAALAATSASQPIVSTDDSPEVIYRRTLEIIAVGDAADARIAAFEALKETGFWKSNAELPNARQPEEVSSSQPVVSEANVSGAGMTDDDISDLIAIAQYLQTVKHWEAQAGSKRLAEITKRLLSASGQAVSEVERLTLEIQNERELHKHWRAKAHTARNAGLESAANKCLSMNYYSHDTRREFANAVLALSSTPAQTEAPVNVPSVDAVIKQSKAVLRLVDEYIDGVQTQQTRTRLRSALMDLFAAAPAQAQTEAQQSEYEIPRVIAFIEQLDKSLEAAGYSHEQRLEITGILMSTKVAAIAKEKAK